MATATTGSSDTVAAADDHADDHHPSDRDYVRIALILGVFTAAEVSTYYIDFAAATIPLLLVLMGMKFVLVAGEFMHLKYDTKVFSRFMGGGLVLAASIYGAVLFMFARF